MPMDHSEEKNDNFLFFTFLFFVKKNVFGKTIVIFCNFSNFHFSCFFWGEKIVMRKKCSLHSLKNVIIYHFLFAALQNKDFGKEWASRLSTDGAHPCFTVLI